MDRARISSMLDGGAGLRLRDGRSVQVRPVRPDDADALQTFVRELSDGARRLRFFSSIRELTPRMLRALTEVGGRPDRVMVAVARDDRGERIVALAQYAAGDDGGSCDLALVVADAWQRSQLGRWLVDMLLEMARDAGFLRAEGDVLRTNEAMLALARNLGFAVTHNPRDATMFRIARDLGEDAHAVHSFRKPGIQSEIAGTYVTISSTTKRPI